MTTKDSLGETIDIGDTVVYATRRRSLTMLKNAVVCGIYEETDPDTGKKITVVDAVNAQGYYVHLKEPSKRTAVVKKFKGKI